MLIDPPLVEGRLLRRYKRFFADVEMADGSVEVTHCPNPGSMLGLATPGARCFVSRSDNPKRKLALTLELVEARESLVCVNTHRANALAAEALHARKAPGLEAYDRVRPEAPYGQNSRVDFLLEGDGLPNAFVEVKSVTLSREPGLAEFPDSKSERAVKHLRELGAVVNSGHRAMVLFLVQRDDCARFSPAADIDPAFARALDEAKEGGVELGFYACPWTPGGASFNPRPLEFVA